MIRHSILAIFLLANTLMNYSQSFTFGIKGNVGSSRIIGIYSSGYYTYKVNSKFRFSYNLGLYTGIKITDKLSLALEAQFLKINGYIQIERKAINGSESALMTYQQSIPYISLPLYLKYRFSKFEVGAGPQVSYIEPIEEYFYKQQLLNSGRYYYKEVNSMKYDYGARILLQYVISEKLFMEASYYQGIHDLLDDYNSYLWSEKWKTQQFSIGIGYRLNNKKTD